MATSIDRNWKSKKIQPVYKTKGKIQFKFKQGDIPANTIVEIIEVKRKNGFVFYKYIHDEQERWIISSYVNLLIS
jgi:hypothetical protein